MENETHEPQENTAHFNLKTHGVLAAILAAALLLSCLGALTPRMDATDISASSEEALPAEAAQASVKELSALAVELPTPAENLLAPVKALLAQVQDLPVPTRDLLAPATILHEKYMDGNGDGFFNPDKFVTRAEAAQTLYNCMAIPQAAQEDAAVFSDVAATAWYAQAVNALASVRLVAPNAEGKFRPDAFISRAELAMLIAPLTPASGGTPASFPDVNSDQSAYNAILKTASAGVISGRDDGLFHPGDPITRAELAVFINRLLGRAPSDTTVAVAIYFRFFPDVPTDHWAYRDIMEAAVSHGFYISGQDGEEHWYNSTLEPVALEDGFHRIGDYLYQVKNGLFLHDVTENGFTFDKYGRYTCGDAEADAAIRAVLTQQTDDTMTDKEKLRALYVYLRDSFTYQGRDIVAKGTVGWEPRYAKAFLKDGKGNCFSFSATFCLLARELGYPAYTVPGHLGKRYQDHCWVEIPEDGINYMYDPQLEWRYLHYYHNSKYDLYHMDPSKTPFTYWR